MFRVVLDTVVFVGALLSPRSRSGQILFDRSEGYVMIFSAETLGEFLEVIQRPELRAKYRSLAKIDIRQILDLVSSAEMVQIHAIPPVVRDPSDDMFIATAIAGNADFIVSEDKDLLSLGSSVAIQVINTAKSLQLLEGN